MHRHPASAQRPLTSWPCPDYCGDVACLKCDIGARREADARYHQERVYAWAGVPTEPWDEKRRAHVHRIVLRNVASTFGDYPLVSGKEVDRLVAEVLRGGLGECWHELELSVYRYARARAAVSGDRVAASRVEQIACDALQKAQRAICARAFLQVGTPAQDSLWATRHVFTHYHPFRPWLARSYNPIADARRRTQGKAARRAANMPVGGQTTLERAERAELTAELSAIMQRVPSLLSIIVQQQTSAPTRYAHLRYTLARLPRRRVAEIDHGFPTLAIGSLPAARTDAEMALLLNTTVAKVHATRDAFDNFVAERHPDLLPTLALMLTIALRPAT